MAKISHAGDGLQIVDRSPALIGEPNRLTIPHAEPGHDFTPAPADEVDTDNNDGETLTEPNTDGTTNVATGASDRLNCKPGHLPHPAPRKGRNGGRVTLTNIDGNTEIKEVKGAPNRLYCKPGHLPTFERLTRLSLTDDRLDGTALLPTGRPGTKDPNPGHLFHAIEGRDVVVGDYHLRSVRHHLRGYGRRYEVHHANHSDPIATVWTYPKAITAGRDENKIRWHLTNHLHYTGEALPLLIGLIDELGATDERLTHWEIQATAPGLRFIPSYIVDNGLTKRHGGRITHELKTKGQLIKGLRVGGSTSNRYATLYRNGEQLDRRNRQYIARRVEADGVATLEQQNQLARLEWNLKGKEISRLTCVDADGKAQPFTLRALATDPTIRLSVYFQQIETGFVFRRKTGKDRYATAEFFNREAIESHYRSVYGITGITTEVTRQPLSTRQSTATHGAKATVKKLLEDSRPGDYLVKSYAPIIEDRNRSTLHRSKWVETMADTLAAAGCCLPLELLTEILTAAGNDLAKAMAAPVSKAAPIDIARIIAAEHGTQYHYRKKVAAAAYLPPVNRLPETLLSTSNLL